MTATASSAADHRAGLLPRVARCQDPAVTIDLVDLARAGDEEAFRQLLEPYRRELQVHCYRMLGSFTDAEDAMQEVLLAAWQGMEGFEGRSSIRTWLYRIATTRCLNARRSSRRQPAVAPPGARPPQPTRRGEVAWLEPYPDALLDGLPAAAPGPEARYEAHEAISLAFITAVQRVPPRQRAALILRDVLGFPASEAARILEVTEESLTSALKRARANLRDKIPARPRSRPADRAAEKDLAERLTAAYQAGDVAAIIALFNDDAWLTMPPFPLEYQGRERIGSFLAAVAFRDGRTYRLIETGANGQLAFGAFLTGPRPADQDANGLIVLAVTGGQIAAMTRFPASALPRFSLGRLRRATQPHSLNVRNAARSGL
jgi:RNA polymerase sigma-70 factor (ECF subfamily)